MLLLYRHMTIILEINSSEELQICVNTKNNRKKSIVKTGVQKLKGCELIHEQNVFFFTKAILKQWVILQVKHRIFTKKKKSKTKHKKRMPTIRDQHRCLIKRKRIRIKVSKKYSTTMSKTSLNNRSTPVLVTAVYTYGASYVNWN